MLKVVEIIITQETEVAMVKRAERVVTMTDSDIIARTMNVSNGNSMTKVGVMDTEVVAFRTETIVTIIADILRAATEMDIKEHETMTIEVGSDKNRKAHKKPEVKADSKIGIVNLIADDKAMEMIDMTEVEVDTATIVMHTTAKKVAVIATSATISRVKTAEIKMAEEELVIEVVEDIGVEVGVSEINREKSQLKGL